MSVDHAINITLEQMGDYEFRVRFDGTDVDDIITDEPEPLGHDAGPNPSRLLVTAVANCLAASLTFALRKFKNTPEPMVVKARANMERNEANRWRIARITVDINMGNQPDELKSVERALAQFENFCVVTESVRTGIEVEVRVLDKEGKVVHTSE